MQIYMYMLHEADPFQLLGLQHHDQAPALLILWKKGEVNSVWNTG